MNTIAIRLYTWAEVDGQTIEVFEEDLSGNLYKLWNKSFLEPELERHFYSDSYGNQLKYCFTISFCLNLWIGLTHTRNRTFIY